MHRILCFSDSHGAPLPSVAETGVVAWLHAGDVCNAWNRELMEERRLNPKAAWKEPADAAVEASFLDRNVPVYIVRGNHDVTDPYRAFERCVDVTGRVVKISSELFVVGVGWSGQFFFDLPLEEELEAVCSAVRRQATRIVPRGADVVLLTHYPAVPPDGNCQRERGCFAAVERLMTELQPVLVVQGHSHEWFKTQRMVEFDSGRRTLVVNPGPGGAEVLIDLGSAALIRFLG